MMRYRTFALMLAAAMLAGTMGLARAEDEPMPFDDPDMMDDLDLDDDDAFTPALRDRGPRGDFRSPRDRDRDRKPGMRGGMMGMGMGMGVGGRMWEELALTPEQKTQMVDLLTNTFRARLEARMEMMDAVGKVRDLRGKDEATGDDHIVANTAVGAARGRMAAINAKFRQDFKKILTPEQFKKLEDTRKGPPPPRPGDRRPGDRKPGDRPDDAKDRRPPPPPRPRG